MSYKNIPRLFIDKELKLQTIIYLNKNDKHYLKNVLRMKIDNTLLLFNGKDGEWLAKIQDNKKFNLKCVELIKKQEVFNGPTFYFSIIKPTNLRWLIEKLTELGVKKICPIVTDYTNSKKFNERKAFHYMKEASEVSERLNLPYLEKLSTFKDFIKKIKNDQENVIFCNENRKDISLAKYFKINFKRKISFLIGPEGGFSPEELKILLSTKNVISVKLNNRIMRAETAAIFSLSTYNTFLDLNEVKSE